MVHVNYTQGTRVTSNKRTDSGKKKGKTRRWPSAASKSGPVTVSYTDPTTLGPITPYKGPLLPKSGAKVDFIAGATPDIKRKQLAYARGCMEPDSYNSAKEAQFGPRVTRAMYNCKTSTKRK